MNAVLTELLVLLGGAAHHEAPEQEEEVTEEDEGWGGGRPAVVLLNQLIPLELPDCVCVVLYLLKCVAVEAKRSKSHDSVGQAAMQSL